MPIYEYVCRDCGEELEQLQRMSDDALTDCPACGEPTLKRKISAAGFRLSGGGWYETDFKSDGKRNIAGDDKSSGSSAKSESNSGDKSSDSKSSASKAESGATSASSDKNASKKSGAKSKSTAGSSGSTA